VDFDGAPVPAGTIIFEPDTSRGNSGPQGAATIIDGKYDTSQQGGQGTVGGHMIVRILGLKQQPDPGNDAPIKPLFQDFEVREEFPKKDLTHDFEVPKAAGEAPARGSAEQNDNSV
jgi:hypothetical protein